MGISNFNCQIVGRIGQDAKVNKVGENNAISFSIAISEKVKDDYVTSWINCTYWSKSDKIAQYLTKGKLISAVADWFSITEKDGKSYTNFRLKDVNPFLEKSETPNVNAPSGQSFASSVSDESDQELPF